MAVEPQNFTEPMKNAAEAMKNAGARAAENTQQINLKVIDHAETNTREAFEALRRAARASSVTEVMQVQGDYVRTQGQRSMEQVREIGELIAGFGRAILNPRGDAK
jgi:hypothetical protein